METAAAKHIAADLQALGLRPGTTVLVHSSLSSLGHVPGAAATVIDGLLAALGPEGTLLLPALSYEHVRAATPDFDPQTTPSNVGTIPEYFRQLPQVRRSLHPTHSVCGLGPAAAQHIEGHRLDRTPCGPDSPFRRLRDGGGKLLFLGCGMRPNTSMHGVEELVEPPYLYGGWVEYNVAGLGVQRYRVHGFDGWHQRYERLAALLTAEGLQQGLVLAAQAQLVDVRQMWEKGEAALRRDPYFFVAPAQ